MPLWELENCFLIQAELNFMMHVPVRQKLLIKFIYIQGLI